MIAVLISPEITEVNAYRKEQPIFLAIRLA